MEKVTEFPEGLELCRGLGSRKQYFMMQQGSVVKQCSLLTPGHKCQQPVRLNLKVATTVTATTATTTTTSLIRKVPISHVPTLEIWITGIC